MLGLFRWPRLEVVCRGSCPSIRLCELINLHARHCAQPYAHLYSAVAAARNSSGLQAAVHAAACGLVPQEWGDLT